jgi:hypothetical protein
MKAIITSFKISLFIIFLIAVSNKNALAQCNNTAQWPTNTVIVNCGANIIVPNIFAVEYNVTKGYQDQSYLTFSSSISTDYITIRKASDNTLIVHGLSPVSLVYHTSYDSLEMHINTSAACTFQNTPRIASVNTICGCNNTFLFPNYEISVSLGDNTLSTIQWAGDFNVTKGYLEGALCTYSSSNSSDFITLRKASNNVILASGITPLSISYEASMGSIEMHINTNNTCGNANVARTTSLFMDYSIYRGGVDDGFVSSCIDQGPNPALTIYSGGGVDGFVSTCIDQGPNPTLTIYRGGIDDGFISTCLDQTANPTLTIYRGGIDDGFISTCIDQGPNPALTIYRGGVDDGFVSTCIDLGSNPVLAIYRGGNEDGFIISCYEQCDGSTLSRWMGNYSIDWHTATKWECGILPTIMSDVIIPSNAQFFPTVTSFAEIKSLYLKPGSAIIIPSSVLLKLHGM